MQQGSLAKSEHSAKQDEKRPPAPGSREGLQDARGEVYLWLLPSWPGVLPGPSWQGRAGAGSSNSLVRVTQGSDISVVVQSEFHTQHSRSATFHDTSVGGGADLNLPLPSGMRWMHTQKGGSGLKQDVLKSRRHSDFLRPSGHLALPSVLGGQPFEDRTVCCGLSKGETRRPKEQSWNLVHMSNKPKSGHQLCDTEETGGKETPGRESAGVREPASSGDFEQDTVCC